MNVELIPGLSNVIRFPVEERVAPSVELLTDIGPEPREALAVAKSFHLEAVDAEMRHEVDCETARHIAEQILPLNLDREALVQRLDEMLDAVVGQASLACRRHRQKAKAAHAAHEAALHAKVSGGFWLAPLEEKADALTRETAVLFLEAYARVLEMTGVSRAIGFARRGETWAPYDAGQNADEWLDAVAKTKSSQPAEPVPS